MIATGHILHMPGTVLGDTREAVPGRGLKLYPEYGTCSSDEILASFDDAEKGREERKLSTSISSDIARSHDILPRVGKNKK